MRLGVNIDHVATLRNSRGTYYPSPLEAAKIVESSGADQVTIHLREDRRHIKEQDVIDIIDNINIDINLELAPTDEMINFAIKHKPNFICLVPEKREELTTEGGINVNLKSVQKAVEKLHKYNIKVCLFIEPSIEAIKKSSELNVEIVEIHTGKYANLTDYLEPYMSNHQIKEKEELSKIIKCAQYCESIKMQCHAGHGLNFSNVVPIAKIKEISELNIGHSLICLSIFDGLSNVIKKMITTINQSRNNI